MLVLAENRIKEEKISSIDVVPIEVPPFPHVPEEAARCWIDSGGGKEAMIYFRGSRRASGGGGGVLSLFRNEPNNFL